MYEAMSIYLRLIISQTKGDSKLFPTVCLQESAQGESDDVT